MVNKGNNKKLKKWTSLGAETQSKLGDKWKRIQKLKGKKPYTAKGASAWLKAQGISGTIKDLQKIPFKTLKRVQERYGE